MLIFLLGIFLFFGIHSISIVNESWRDQIANRMGIWPWKGVYSLVSILGFVLIVKGYGLVRVGSIELYSPPHWLQYVSLLLALPVFPLLLAAYIPGRIRAMTGHPMLLATSLWAVAHLLASGTLVNCILFGTVLCWSVADRISLQRRQPRAIPGAPASKYNDVIAVVGGVGIYIAFVLWFHLLLTGVSAY